MCTTRIAGSVHKMEPCLHMLMAGAGALLVPHAEHVLISQQQANDCRTAPLPVKFNLGLFSSDGPC